MNLVILEVGEWRGFLTVEDRNFIKNNRLDGLMYSAYLCTTISTVIAMISSFLASQHAFCFQQILAEKDASSASSGKIGGNPMLKKMGNGSNVVHHNHHLQQQHHHHMHRGFDHGGEHDEDTLMTKVCYYLFIIIRVNCGCHESITFLNF